MTTRATSPVFHFSPSEHHRRVMDQTKQELAYSGGDLAAWQRRLRRRLASLIGDVPRERVPLRPRTIWKREHALGSIEKVVFTSEACCDVPAFVCLPRDAKPPYTFMICLQGHSTGMHNSIAVQRDDNSLRFPDLDGVSVGIPGK